jgi:putative ABC transport system ATP-binding protein
MSEFEMQNRSSNAPELLDEDALAFLCRAIQLRVERTQIQRCLQRIQKEARQDSLEPLERLTQAASALGLRIQPVRLSLREAVWMAREDQPFVAWSLSEKRWLILRRHGFFRARVSDPERPMEVDTMGHGALLRRLGWASAEGDFGFVSLDPAGEASVGWHGHGEELMPSVSEPGAHQEPVHLHLPPLPRLIGLLRAERSDVWTILLFSLVTGILYLGLPLAMNALVSNLAFGTQSAPFQQALLVLALALFGALLLSGLIRVLQYYLVEVIQRRMFVRVASTMAFRLPRLKVDVLDDVHAPELVNRFLDVVTVQKTTALLLLDGINLVLGASMGLILLGFYHPFLLSFSLLMLIAIGFIVFGLGRGAVSTSIQESICKYDMVNWLEEIARYPRIFKGPGGYALAMERADRLSHAFLEARGSHFGILLRQIIGLVVLEVVATSALLVVGGWLVLSMQITLGQLVASELIVGAVVASMPKLAKKFEAWYDAMAALDKLGHLVDLELERQGGEVPQERPGGYEVRLVGASVSYPEGNSAFSELSAEIESGSRVALIGPEGGGCSTLMDVLFGVRSLSSGYVQVGGLDLRSWNLEELRRGVLLLRANDVVEGTIAENVRLGRSEIGLEEVHSALESVGLLEWVMSLPQGMHTPMTTGGSLFSSRQRVRLLLARAIAMRPKLLLVDEVLDVLDREAARELLKVIGASERPWTLVIATQDPVIAESCGRRVLMGGEGSEPVSV